MGHMFQSHLMPFSATNGLLRLLSAMYGPSVQFRDHLLLRHRGKAIDIKPLGGQDWLNVSRDELAVQVWCDGEFCETSG